jgi:hypothetical protein
LWYLSKIKSSEVETLWECRNVMVVERDHLIHLYAPSRFYAPHLVCTHRLVCTHLIFIPHLSVQASRRLWNWSVLQVWIPVGIFLHGGRVQRENPDGTQWHWRWRQGDRGQAKATPLYVGRSKTHRSLRWSLRWWYITGSSISESRYEQFPFPLRLKYEDEFYEFYK